MWANRTKKEVWKSSKCQNSSKGAIWLYYGNVGHSFVVSSKPCPQMKTVCKK